MKKITLNEELNRIQEMMGVKHISPSGKETNMSPNDDDYEINYGKNAIKELSPSDIVGSMREEETDENIEVLNKFKDQYGDKAGEKVYYATANKQDRDPETFEKNESMDPSDYEEDGLSDCCGAPIVIHDICSECGEHCEAENWDEEGTDEAWDLAMERIDKLEKELEEEGSWMAMRAGKDGKVFEGRAGFHQENFYDTQAAALESAEEYAKHKGFTVNWESITPEHVAYEKTVQYHVEILKDGKPLKKMLQISLYRMPSGKYELTNYIM